MTLEDCYEDKKLIIKDLIDESMAVLFDDIELDAEYDLSTDEIAELCTDLMKMYVKKELQ